MENDILKNLALNPAKVNASADACCDVDHTQHAEFSEKTESWDKWGMVLSGICAVHCLATPLLILAIPMVGEMFESEWVHALMALFILPVGLYAFWSGYKHHREWRVLTLGLVGLALVLGALVLPHELIDLVGHHTPTILGSALLILAHFLNRRACLCHKHAAA